MDEADIKAAKDRLEIDIDDLHPAFISQSDEATWILNLQTGKVSLYFDGMLDGMLDGKDVDEDFGIDESLDPDVYRVIQGISSSEGYEIMEEFIDQLPQSRAKQVLSDAIAQKKPFRRFKDALEGLGSVRDQWFKFEKQCQYREIKRWAEEEELDVVLVKKVDDVSTPVAF